MFSAYRSLVAKIDSFSKALYESQAEHLVCGAGCDACCQQLLSFAPVEVLHIADWLSSQADDLRTAIGAQVDAYKAAGATQPCPLLDNNGRCLIYPVRPIVCRTHGLILNLAEGGQAANLVRSCNLNYTAIDLENLSPAQALSQPLISALIFQTDGLFARASGLYRHGERWTLLDLTT
jgi:Fe-S-cluster containining protein